MNNIDLNEKEECLVIEKFSQLKSERTKYTRLWKDVQDYVAITNNINSEFESESKEGKEKDLFINDPTGFICTNQAGDYLAGILWNLEAITLEPTDEVKKAAGGADLSGFYKKATKITLEQMNSTDAGFLSILKSYCYDQFSYATSGIGVFRSKEYDDMQTECCLNFKAYGVHNSCFDEGANNKINVVYTVYNWSINRIIEEFCIIEGEFNEEAYKRLPEKIRNAYDAKKLNEKHKLVFGILPNKFYKLEKRGKVGAKFKGYWFLDGDKKIFNVEYFSELPVAVCRFIRVNGQVYGESSGTLAISSIKMLNHIMGDTIDNIEKITDAPLGIVSGALVAGNVLNRTAGSVTQFNPQAIANGQSPIFPIAQAGDISAVVNFLLPMLNKNITNIFKIDQLLDFNNQTQMTATESSFRMSIRGKSISGVLSQQKDECIEPVCHRAIAIIKEAGLYGQSLEDMQLSIQAPEDAIAFELALKENNFIPEAVAAAMKNNKRWYKLKFNGELEKLCNAELYESIGRFLQYFASLLQMKPEIIYTINEYEFLELLKKVSNLVNDNLVKTKTEYNAILAALEEARAQQEQMQNAIDAANVTKQYASAEKDTAMAGSM